ncbi:MAG: right-handed parallel beta-helix repeat-containing protein [bacterium]
MDAAAPGDTVLVRSGTYSEVVRIFAKSGLCLIGDGPVEDVVVCHDSVVVDVRETDPAARVEGLTVTCALAFGGLFTQEARVEVVGCVFRDNVGPGGCHGVGGAINAMSHSDLLIENNTDWEAPGGVIIWQSRADIRGNIFRGNSSCYGGGLEMYHCETEPVSYIEDNLFVANSASLWGGAIFNVDSSPVIRRNTFYGGGTHDSATIWVLGGSPIIDLNVIVGTTWGVFCQWDYRYPESTPVMGTNLFWDVQQPRYECSVLPGTAIVGDPLFCDANAGDFTLCADSPALSSPAGRLGAFDAGCAPCDLATEPATWGAVKALYR